MKKQQLPKSGSRKFLFSLLMVMLLMFSMNVYSQDDTPIYSVVSLMKVKPVNNQRYEKMEKELWKPLHQELLNQGKIIGWYLYRIQYTGTGDEYNYATVTHYLGRDNLGNRINADVFKKVHPDKEMEDMIDETLERRDMVTSRQLRWLMQSLPEQPGEPARYAVINYMKVPGGMNGEFLTLRREIVKPVFDEALKEGLIDGWGLWQLNFPSGQSMPWNFATGDFYNDFNKISQGGQGAVYEKVHAGKDLDEISKRMNATRVMVKRELWSLIDYVNK